MLRVGVNLFWLAFLADGLLSLLDEALSWQAGFSPLTVLRSLVAFLVLVFSLVMAGVMVLTPRAPVRLLLPMILFCWWVGPGLAFPLGGIDAGGLPLGLAALQVLLAGLLWVRRKAGAGARFLPFAVNGGRPLFAWKHALLTGPVVVLLAMTFAVISVCSGLASEIETFSGGYIRLRHDGIYLLERKFQSADREVRLTGMMHIAQGDFYSGVLPEADPSLPSIVLVEGVTDHQGLLSQGALRYTKVARLFKATSQDESEFNHHVMNGLRDDYEGAVPDALAEESASDPVAEAPVAVAEPAEEPKKGTGIDFRHADVDIESFHPTTIAFLVAVVGVIQSEDLRSVVRSLADPTSPLSDEKAQVIVMQDILYSRNDRLRTEIQASLRDYRRVIVPWGALHLAEIEAWLRTQNFEQSGEVERKALGFW